MHRILTPIASLLITLSVLIVLLAPLPAEAEIVTLTRDASSSVSVTVSPAEVVVSGVLACTPDACGDDICSPSENLCNSCGDCGTPDPAESLCSNSSDDDCDGLIDCADSDCSLDPVCDTGSGDPPPSSSPPQSSLEGWWSWDESHSVVCGDGPVQTIQMGGVPSPGSCIHHLIDKSTDFPVRELTEVDSRWWPEATSDGILFTESDQLVFRTCTSLDPLVCSDVPWELASTDSWSFVFIGYIHSSGYILGYPVGTTGASYVVVSAAGAWQLRVQGFVKRIIGGAPMNTRMAVVIERQADTSLKMHVRRACQPGFADTSSGNVTTAGIPAFGCVSCYFQNETNPSDPLSTGMAFFREAMIYRRDFAADRADLLSYIESEHGTWLDDGCP